MKLRRTWVVITAMLLQAVVACDAIAAKSGRSGSSGRWSGSHGGYRHSHGHVFFGAGFYAPWYPWYPGYYGYPSYYGHPYYYYPAEAPIYIEQYAVPLPSGFWYYCHSAGAYYPGVAECPEGWEQVAPESGKPL